MVLLDVNLLLAAHREDHPDHSVVRHWFEDLLSGQESFAVPAMIWASFLRLATNRRIFPVPTPLTDAFDFVEAVVAQPHHLAIRPGGRHLELVKRLCLEGDAVGDLIPDAVIAALALEHGASVATLDRDFARFASVKHLNPLAAWPPSIS
ncbi:type II toxin-antitoxin system VapC family toxin [soil metagenome]